MPQRLALGWIVQGVAGVLGLGGLLLGAGLVLGGKERFGGPSFNTARALPGEQDTWGGALVVLGLIVLWATFGKAHYRTLSATLFAEGVWFMFFALSLAQAAMQIPTAAATGPFAYGMLAGSCIVLAVGLRRLPQ
ncbi:hypothetical protein [Kineosporia succinea]|uniref:Uncharacterized protein n=1 Tax=Kineosporia succinea TaxID=84632 RepID=A0ABT9PA94_9ACTN|nr:hypothetical protein [Kineosporia succinea]MDP9829471.1 hypothetical protein [Kineosporia succinea]